MLEARNLNTFYGAAHVLFDLSIDVGEGEVVCMLGRNGVGKTTCLRSIMGLTPPRGGDVLFRNKPIQQLQPFEISRLGIGYVPEDRRIFPDLTVRDNLEIGIIKGRSSGIEESIATAFQIFPPLEALQNKEGGKLSGGEQQMLTIARTLMGKPDLLLIDEPTEGLSPIIVDKLEDTLLQLKAQGFAMLLAAQDFRFATRVSDRIFVIDRGRVVYSGSADQVRADDATVRSFLVV